MKLKLRLVTLFIFVLILSTTKSQDYKKSYWSVTIDVGANQFDGDMEQAYNSLIPTARFKTSFGASIEYTLNPVWGIGLEYYYLPLSAAHNAESFTSTMHHINPYLAVNMFNLLASDIKTKWGLWATLGGGFGFYNSSYYTNNILMGSIPDGKAFTVPVGAIIEYNISKSVALGAKIQYRSHNKDNLEANPNYNFSGVTNDYISLGSVSLRWKINAINKSHTRNTNNNVFFSEEFMLPAREAKAKADSLQMRVNHLQNEISALKPNLSKIAMLENRLNDIENKGIKPTISDNAPVTETPSLTNNNTNNKPLPDFGYYNNSNQDDADQDGVPDNRDKEPKTPENTAVDFWGRTLKGDAINGFAGIFFDFNKTDLDDEANKAIKMVAEKLRSNPGLMVEIRGYADFIGNEEYNRNLSKRRADKVKNELVNRYEIEPIRIISNGKGKVLKPKTAYRQNRKCNFYLSE